MRRTNRNDLRIVATLLAFAVFPGAAQATTPSFTGMAATDGVIATVLYSAIGIIMAAVSYKVVDILTPGDLSKELTENKNMALAILAGAMILGICLIIAAAIAG